MNEDSDEFAFDGEGPEIRQRGSHSKKRAKRNIISVPNFTIDTSKLVGPHKPGKWEGTNIEESAANDPSRVSPLLAAQEAADKKYVRMNKVKGLIIALTKPVMFVMIFLSSFEGILTVIRGS